MKVLISGASGLVGTAVTNSLSQKGHQVVALQRNTTKTTPYWHIDRQEINLGRDQQVDVVIHLAGESIASGRWSRSKKERILRSRVAGTTLISEFFAKANYRPKILISASAIGFYGNRGSEELTEDSARGSGFLADVCQQWEDATAVAAKSGIRVMNIRSGMILSANGGALAKMLPPFKLGLGGVIGAGHQYISWISINDLVEIINHIIHNEDLRGPINLVSPNPVTNYDFTKKLGEIIRRPTILPLPPFLAEIIFGEMAKELLLASTRVRPGKLQKSGYNFKYPTLEMALRDLLST